MNTAALPIALSKSAYPAEFDHLWALKPNRGPGNNKRKCYRAYCTRLKEGHAHKDMLSGMLAYKECCRQDGSLNTKWTMMMATFFGVNCHFDDDWTPIKTLPRHDSDLEFYAADHGLSKAPMGYSCRQYRHMLEMELRA